MYKQAKPNQIKTLGSITKQTNKKISKCSAFLVFLLALRRFLLLPLFRSFLFRRLICIVATLLLRLLAVPLSRLLLIFCLSCDWLWLLLGLLRLNDAEKMISRSTEAVYLA
ncbi:hypothetical protein K449DRAFT_185244 [Hypoxylon sp. EC38]|nr:hypothetical protein K449DRAFT_185244 [Hypoxylon sp. EC38]